MSKILYGCCYKADLEIEGITYIDIIPNLKKSHGCDYLCKDIRQVDFNEFDIILCSPPCNYYSRGNYRRDSSAYSLSTRDLLPLCINRAYKTNKPFIIENVRNMNMFKKLDIPNNIFIYEFGRHTYFSNVMFSLENLPQINDNINYIASTKRQGGFNVNVVFKRFLSVCLNKDFLGGV